MRPTLCFAAAFALAACAGVAPSSLQPAAPEKSVTLSVPLQYEEYYKLSGTRWFLTVNAGTYSAKYRNNEGTYYEGEGNCLTSRPVIDVLTKQGKPQLPPRRYRCGVYVPNSPSAEPRIYFYRDPEAEAAAFRGTTVQVVDKTGAPSTAPGAAAGGAIGFGLVQAISAAELKNLHFYPDQPKPGQLRAALQE